MSNRLDHIVLALNELDSYRSDLVRLGFHLSNVGRHPELGTTNTVVVFEDNYFELFCAPADANDLVAATRADIENNGEGLLSVSLKTNGAQLEANRLGKEGSTLPIHIFHRPVNEPGAQGEAEFQAVIVPNLTERQPSFFFCDHKTPELVWSERALLHANGVKTISEIVLCVQEPEALAPQVETLCPTALSAPVEGGIRISGDGPVITILNPAAFESRGGKLSAGNGADHRKCIVVFEVDNLSAIAEIAERENIVHQADANEIRLRPFAQVPCIHFAFRGAS